MMLLIVPLPLASSTFSDDERAPGAMPGLLAVRVVAVAGDDAGDVRAVAVVVVGLRAAVDEVDELRDALIAVRVASCVAVLRQVVVPVGDAGVDDRDADVLPV